MVNGTYYTRCIVTFVKQHKSIKDLPKTQRPRERLAAIGVANLTDEELIALLLGTGVKKQNVLSVAKKLLKQFPRKNLSSITIKDITKVFGIGIIQAGKILAAIELGKRIFEEGRISRLLDTLDHVVKEVEEIKIKSQEHMVALYMNARYQLLDKKVVAIGSINQQIIEPRDIFAPAFIVPCAFVILVHNHPSRDPLPSIDDITFTKKMIQAGDLLGISILDHVIVTNDTNFSFKEGKVF